MNERELVIAIGNEVCEGCGPDCDCGEDPSECMRVATALGLLGDFLEDEKEQTGEYTDPRSNPSEPVSPVKHHKGSGKSDLEKMFLVLKGMHKRIPFECSISALIIDDSLCFRLSTKIKGRSFAVDRRLSLEEILNISSDSLFINYICDELTLLVKNTKLTQ